MPDDPLDRFPPGSGTATVKAVGKLSVALETIEEARSHLYAFHRLTGTADSAVGEAADGRPAPCSRGGVEGASPDIR